MYFVSAVALIIIWRNQVYIRINVSCQLVNVCFSKKFLSGILVCVDQIYSWSRKM